MSASRPLLATLLLLAGCASVPVLPGAADARDAAYPTLRPFESLPSATVPADGAAAIGGELDARAAALRARAAALAQAGG